MGSGGANRTARVASILGFVGVVWFTLVAMWGMFGVPGGGHYAAVFGLPLAAENMIRWKIVAPVGDYVATPPLPAQYYCHHPFGVFWAQLPGVAVFGHHDWVAYLPAVVMSGLTALFVNRAANNAWGRTGAFAATAGFVTLPITLAFANYPVLEVVTMFGWSLLFWAQSELLKSWKARYALLSALGAAIASSGDWIGFVGVGLFLGFAMLRGFVLPKRLFPPIRDRPYAKWWTLTCVVTCAFFFLWLVLFFKWGQLTELLSSANQRSSGADQPLSAVLEARKYRIDSCFTPLAIFLGKVALPVALIRLVVRRRDEEAYSIVTWIAATVQYVGFKQGADIHVFWPHDFGLYFAFAFGQLVVTLEWLTRGALRWFRRPWASGGATAVAIGFTALFIVLILPDALRGLRTGRETWGRFNEENLRSDTDETRVVEMLSKSLAPGQTLDAHMSLRWSWHLSWATHGLHQENNQLPTRANGDPATHPFYVMRASWTTAKDLSAMAKDFKLQFYGDILVVDRRQPPGPADAYTFAQKEPNSFEWFFLGGTEPVETLAYDPFATWEWRTHLGQPATPPREEPKTPNELRIAHNIAVTAGDAPRAAALRTKLEAMLDRGAASTFTQGIELLGTRRIRGSSPRLEMWWLADGGPTAGEGQFNIVARMDGPEPTSWIPPDTFARPFCHPMPIPTKLWKPGFLYSNALVLYHRIGVETYLGSWASRDGGAVPAPNDGHAAPLPLLTVR